MHDEEFRRKDGGMPEIKRRSGRRIGPGGGYYEIAHAFQEDSELLEN
jgi:hypothetical protein